MYEFPIYYKRSLIVICDSKRDSHKDGGHFEHML